MKAAIYNWIHCCKIIWKYLDISHLDVLFQSASERCAVRRGIESGAVHRADRHSEDRNRSQSVTLQGCGADIGWGKRGSGTAHCHSSPGTALGRTDRRLWAHYKVWKIGHRCCRLDGRHCCCGPVLTVTCSCEWKKKKNNITHLKPLSYNKAKSIFLLVIIPVLTALRAWFTVICELTCKGIFGCWPVAVWAAVTTAAGWELAGTALEHTARGLLKSGPETMAPRVAEEGLTMVTPLPAWVHRLMGTLGWVLPDAVLRKRT